MCSRKSDKTVIKDDKIAHLYKTRDWADCIFFFEGEEISAHKLILTCCSPVFESMFYGSLASAEIHISDIEPDDFKQMLEFVYTDSVTISSIQNAWSLLYISQKYFLHDLKALCMEYINFNLTLSTLLLSYEYAELYNLRQLSDRCWRDILLLAKELLQMDYHMQASTFCSLLEESEINVNETDLTKAALKWAEEECALQTIEATREKKLDILIKAGIFPRLRFACLGKDSYHYLNQLLSNNLPNLPDCVSLINSNTEERRRVPFHVKFKFRETYKIERNIVLDQENEFRCMVATDRKIVAYGVAVTPPHQGGFLAAHSDVVVCVTDKLGNLLYKTKGLAKVTSDYEHPHLVNFDEGVAFEADTPYRISVKYSSVNNPCKPNELLCFYLGSTIKTHANSLKLYFSDKVCGGVVRGISYYVV